MLLGFGFSKNGLAAGYAFFTRLLSFQRDHLFLDSQRILASVLPTSLTWKFLIHQI
jgi:hypothetical protein